MKELETLLNTLIQMGWKPWNVDVNCDISIKIENNRIKIYFELKTWVIVSNSGGMSLRELVSLESWLWQFCAEKGLLNSLDQYPNKDFRAKNPRPYWEMSLRRDCYYKTEVYQYRLLESALIPEEELGQFLIDNIKTE